MLKPSRYFRVSVTKRCNLSCIYCHKEGNYAEKKDELLPEEIQLACRIARDAGFRKFKLTGGEPTLRHDLCTIISLLARLDLPDLSMITNGTTLMNQAGDLWKAGLRRMNVSLNTLDQKRFQRFQTSNSVSISSVLKGIETAKQVGFRDIKINFVYCDADSDSDLDMLLEYTNENNLSLVVLPVIDEEHDYTLDFLYNKIRTYGIETEDIILDNEGIRKRRIRLNSGACVLLRLDELFAKRPYYFCDDCFFQIRCREGIFPIRLSSSGEIIPCMATVEHRISIRDLLTENDEDGIRQVFSTIRGWNRFYE